jgi:SNF2 family DNA or RNA helicase
VDQQLTDGPAKVVLFCPLPDQAHLVAWWFQTHVSDVDCFLLKAKMSLEERVGLVNAFSAAGPSILISTPALAGTGINLTTANHVVIMQKFWNLNEQRQAVARIHRLGQKRKCHAWIIHVSKGVDDRAAELQEVRGKLEARVMHGLMDTDITYMELMGISRTRARNHERFKAKESSEAEDNDLVE